MKLYLSPGACSMSPHIVLEESGLSFETEKVDLKTKLTASGADYRGINGKGSVPALMLDDGSVLTEGPAIVQYIADKVPALMLAPPAGTPARYRLIEWLNYISTEIHKGFSPLFSSDASEQWKTLTKANLAKKFTWISEQLADKSFLMGESFSVADAYLFTVLNWTNLTHIDLAPWPALQAYIKRIAARPAVQAAMKDEGLIKT